jgi:hypothetical protein
MKRYLQLGFLLSGLILTGFLVQAQIGGGGITGGGGGGFTTGTFTVTWEQACTTNPTQTWNYAVSGNVVILAPTEEVSCTSDSTSFISAAGDLPAAIRQNTASVVSLAVGVRAQDNGADTEACLRIESGFSLALSRVTAGFCSTANNWTASGTKAMFGTTNPSINNFVYYRDRT